MWKRNGSLVLRHNDNMQSLLPRVMGAIYKQSYAKLFKPDFFSQYHVKSLKTDIKIVAPVLRFPNGEVKLGFDVGTRTNGVDQPRWPKDLSVEVVS